MSSLRIIGQGLNFDPEKLNLGIGSSFFPNIRLAIYNNNPQSWKTAIFKNTPDSDYLSIGSYNCNIYLAAIANDNQNFKDLYINNLGTSSPPLPNIGNIIMNGKVTIGNFSNNTIFNHPLDVVSQTNNIALFRNDNYQLSISCNSSSIIFNTNNNRIGIIPDTYLSSNLYVSGVIFGSNYLSNIINPSLHKIPANWVKINTVSAINTNVNNELELNIDTNRLAIINGKLTVTGLYDGPGGVITSNLYATDFVSIASNGYVPTLNERLFVNGGVTIGSNAINSSLNFNKSTYSLLVSSNAFFNSNVNIAGNLYSTEFVSIASNNYVPTLNERLFVNGGVTIGSNAINPSLNFNKSTYSLLVSSNAFFNSNITVAGNITGNGDNLSNLNLKNIINPSSAKLSASWINIKPSQPIKASSDSNDLYLDFDNTSALYVTPLGKLSLNIDTTNFSVTNGKLMFMGAIGIGGTNITTSNLYATDFVSIASNSYVPSLNDRLFVNGGVTIGSGAISPLLNFNKSTYSLLVSSNAFFNSNVNVAGIITGYGDNLSNLNLRNIVNPSLSKIPSSWINIKPSNPIKSSIDNDLYLDFDNTSALYVTPLGKLSLNIDTTNFSVTNGKLMFMGGIGIGGTNITTSNLYATDFVSIASNSYVPSLNDRLFVNGGVTIGANPISPWLNFNKSTYSLLVSSNAYFNSNVNVAGIITGYGDNLSNLNLRNIVNPSLSKIPASWINIKESNPIKSSIDNDLYLDFDNTSALYVTPLGKLSLNIDTNGFSINNGKLTLTGINGIGGINTCNLYSTDFVSIASNGYVPTLNERLFVNGGVSIGTNTISPSLNFNKSTYSLLVSSNAFFNSNVNVAGVITGNGDNLSNLNLKNIINPSSAKLSANWINIKPSNPIKATSDTNELYLDFDNNPTNGFYLTPSGKLSLNIGSVSSSSSTIANHWNSNTPSEIYFNNGDSFVGIGNANPRSLLWIGLNGNLLRLTSPASLNTSYYTQISTNDNANNNTNIRLITPTPLNQITGADVSLSAGSIYYTTAGDNPSHNFIYEKDGNKTNLMNIYKSGIVTVGCNIQLPATDTDKMKVYGNLSINSSNNIPGKLIIGTSNAETNDYSLYVNNNAKFNNKVIIGTTITSFDGFPIITEYPLNVYGNIGITGNIFTTSDEKVKTNIETIENSLDKICKCRGVSFKYLNDSNKNQYGVIAQEIEKIIPDVVESNQYGYKNVNYLAIIGFLIEAVKELNNKITSNRI